MPSVAIAPPELRHQVYATLLRMLRLSDAHAEGLERRGLAPGEIASRTYGSLPSQGRAKLARRVADAYGLEMVLTVPGFVMREHGGRRWLSISGAPGLLIPCRDLSGRIIALKVRADQPQGPNRYTYLSSRRFGGPGPGAPVHIPLFRGSAEILRITEGELKADISTALSGVRTISVAGVTNWRPALPVIRELVPTRVRVAFDADWKTNVNVRRSLQELVGALIGAGVAVEIETWS